MRNGKFTSRCDACSPGENVPRQASRINFFLNWRGVSGTGTDFRPGASQAALCKYWESTGFIKGREAAWWKKITDDWQAKDANIRKGLSEDGKRSLSEDSRFDEIHVDKNGTVLDRDGYKTDFQAEPVADAEDSVPWPVGKEEA